MVANDGIALAAFVRGPFHHVFGGPIMALHVEVCRSEMVHGLAEIPRDGQRLEKNFRQDDGRTEIQEDAAFQLRHHRRKFLKVQIAGFAQHGPVGGGVLMNDVGSDGNVDGHRDVPHYPVVEQAQFFPVERSFHNGFAEGPPGADALLDPFGQRGIHEAPGFVNHSERAVVQTALDVLTGFADQREFKVVDGPGAIQREGVDDPAPQQFNQNRIETAFNHMRPHHQDDRPLIADGVHRGIHDGMEIIARQDARERIEELRETAAGLPGLGEIASLDLIIAFAQWVGAEAGEIERGKIHI